LRVIPTSRISKGVAQLAIICDVPGVNVEINGATRTKTPVLTPLLVPGGALTVRFSRPGYAPSSKSLTAMSGEIQTVECDQRKATPLPAALAARLVVRTVPADADVIVDGQRFFGAALPAGDHLLRLERDGFRPQQRTLSLKTGKLAIYQATLTPTPASREREQRAISRRKTGGIVLGSVGAALLATGVGVYAWNSGRYNDWRSKRDQSNPDANIRLATSIQRADDVSLGLLFLGAGLTLGGSWLFYGAE
jgi:hypothetical protein